jgi:predicted O-methyltransferase YrrM
MASRVEEIVSYDQDANWQRATSGLVSPQCRVTFEPWADDVPDRLLSQYGPESFDLVLVDTGCAVERQALLRKSIELIKPGGVLMADNADTGWVAPIIPELHTMMPDWDYAISIARHPDRFGFGMPGWATAWWERPGQMIPGVLLEGNY